MYIVKDIISYLCDSVIQVIVNCLLAFCSANISVVVCRFILSATDLLIKSILYSFKVFSVKVARQCSLILFKELALCTCHTNRECKK